MYSNSPDSALRLPVVAVFGMSKGNVKKLFEKNKNDAVRLLSHAREIGRWLAGEEVHLLTGGGGGVMAAAAEGFATRPGRAGLSIGVLPAANPPAGVLSAPKPGYPNDWIELPIATHLDGTGIAGRNPINALTTAFAIVLQGGKGTADEVNLTVAAGKTVIVPDFLNQSCQSCAAFRAAMGLKTSHPHQVIFVSSMAELKHAVVQQLEQERLKGARTTKRIHISFGSNAEGTLTAGGNTYPCLGQAGRQYPQDLTVTENDKEAEHYSNEFQVMMYWAILIWGQKGIYIHEGPDTIASNGNDDSAGCIHLANPNAETVFNWLDSKTRITIEYPW